MGLCFNIKIIFPGIKIPIIKIRWSWDLSQLENGHPFPGNTASLNNPTSSFSVVLLGELVDILSIIFKVALQAVWWLNDLLWLPKLQWKTLTLNVRGPSYLCLTRSISWLLMPWLLRSPGHQQPWYWLCRICRSWSYLRKDFKYLCHINME